MPRRRDDGVLADLFETAAALPWWVDVAIAVVAYAVFGHLPAAKAPGGTAPADIGHVLGMMMRKGLLLFGQYIIPLVLLLGAAASALGRRRRKGLLRDVAGDESGRALRAMDWRDFELLVGEAFRRRGFWVTETGGGGADGGVDLKLEKDGEVFLVQCKQWRAYKVSVNVVRELLGVMVARGAAGGFVVTSGVFTKEAREFAKGSNIELLDGAALMAMIGEERIARAGVAPVVEGTGQAMVASPSVGAPACPACGREMMRRTARRGASAGGDFWGCAGFPRCRGTRPID